MRSFATACAALSLLATAAQAAEIKTGRDLANACRTQDPEGKLPNDCDTFVKGFFVSLAETQRARTDAMVKGIPYTSKEACVRMPDHLTRKDMAARIVTFVANNVDANDQAATIVAQRTLEHDFPCPQQTPAPR